MVESVQNFRKARTPAHQPRMDYAQDSPNHQCLHSVLEAKLQSANQAQALTILPGCG